ncbi:DUF3006 domain-containing protein [Clostridium sp. DL1XJH146]
MKGIIDRFEGNFAIVELDNGEITKIPMNIIPIGLKEGQVLKIKDVIEIDYKETERRQAEIKRKTEELWDD